MPQTSFIILRTHTEGLHHWPSAAAPDGYLATPHRHLFTIETQVQVFHDDREIEINAATRWLASVLAGFADSTHDGSPPDFGPQSCETLAARTIEAVTGRFGAHREIRCHVLEDGLLGAGVHWTPAPA